MLIQRHERFCRYPCTAARLANGGGMLHDWNLCEEHWQAVEYLSSIERPRISVDPFAEKLWLRAQRYIEASQIGAARTTLESLVRREPDRVAARMLLASVYLSEGHVREAAEQAVFASTLLPDDADAVATTVQCLLQVGETVAARDVLRRFDAASKDLPGDKLTAIAHVHQMLGEDPIALALMDRAQAQGYDNPDFRYFHGLQLQFNGRIEEALKEMEGCLKLGPTFGRASLTLARARRQTPDDNHLEFIRGKLRSVEPGSEDHAAFEFAQYKELEDLGRYDEAFAALERGNAVKYSRLHHDPGREAALFEAIIEHTGAEFLQAQASRAEEASEGPMPIFVVGLPRSGTTLLDRILDNHPDVRSTGERIDFPRQLRWTANQHGQEVIDAKLLERLLDIDYVELGRRYLAQTRWRAGGKAYFVDKLPPNYMLLGFIHRALPRAPILHMVRDPMDVCFSNYRALFGDSYAYSYDLQALASHYRCYRKLMQHWHAAMPGRIFDVDYGALVRNPDDVIAAILAYCGLRQVPGCGDVTRNDTAVNTLSSAQVREPIHTRTLGVWQRYTRQLEPLRTALSGYLSAK